MPYNAGQMEVDIVPSLGGFDTAMDAEAVKAGDRIGGLFADAFKARVQEQTKDAPIGPSDEDSTRQGTSTGGKFADAFKARVTAALKSLPDVPLTADSTDTDRKLADIRAQLDTLRTQKIGVDISDDEAMAKLAELKAALVSIGASSDSVRIKVDTSAAIGELVAFKAAADAVSGAGGAGGGLNGIASSAANAGDGISNLVSGAAALGPALIPITAVGAAGFASLAAMMLSAGLGLGAFALAAENDLGQVGSVLKETLADFQKLAEPVVLPVIDNGLGLIIPLFSTLMPLVDSTAGELTHLENAGSQALNAPFWRGFITFIDSEASPALDTFATFAGGVGKAFAGLSIAFGPVITDVEHGIDGISARLASFGENADSNTGLQHFIAYVEQEAPVVGHFLENLGGDVSGLLTDLAPAGAVVLQVVTGLTGFLKVLEDLHAGPLNLPELLIAGLAINKVASWASSGAKALEKFRLATLAVDDAGVASAGGLAGLVASLGGLGVLAGVVLPPLAIGIGLFALLSASSRNFDAEVQKLIATVLALPTSTLPQLQVALTSTRSRMDELKSSSALTENVLVNAGKAGGIMTTILTPAGAAVQKLSDYMKTLNDDVKTQNTNLDTLENAYGLSKTSAEALASSLNINLSKALTTKQLGQFNAALQQQETQSGLSGEALRRLADTAQTSTAAIASDVSAATKAATTSWQSFGDVVTAFSSSTGPVAGSSISTFFEETETQAAQFAANIQLAIAKGYDPTIISQIAQAGPAKAAQLLQGLVDTQGTALQGLITQAEAAITKEGAFAIEEARLTQEAVSSKSSATAAELGSALAISQALTSSNVMDSVNTVISHLSGGLPEFVQIASDYGIALPNGLLAQLEFTSTSASSQAAAALTNLGAGLLPLSGIVSTEAGALPAALESFVTPAGAAAFHLSGAATDALDSAIVSFLNAGSSSGQNYLNGILSALTGSTTLSQIINASNDIGSTLISVALQGASSHPPIPTTPKPFPGLTVGAGHAAGGPVSAGVLYPVNELGTEMFMPKLPGTILSHTETVSALSSMSGTAGPVIHQENHFAPGVDRAGVRAEVDQSNAELLATLEAQGTR